MPTNPDDIPAYAIQDYIQVRDDDWNEVNRALRYIWDSLDSLSRKQNTYPAASVIVTQPFADETYGPGPIRSGLIHSGFLPVKPTFNFGNSSALSLTAGTLSPDTKPTTFTVLNAYQELFYSTDYDHTYIWTGSAWLVMERTVGKICWFKVAPATAGWQLCDGSTVNQTTSAGALASTTVPDLITGNPYIRGGNAYSGPTATAAIAPTITPSANTGTESNGHTHSVTAAGSVTGNVPDHAHVLLDNLVDGGGLLMSHAVFLDGTAWDVAGTLSGFSQTTDLNHVHFNTDLCVVTGTGDTAAFVSQLTADVEVSVSDHVHSGTANGYSDLSLGLNHDHGVGSYTWTSTSESHFHLVTGRTETTISGGPVALSLTFTGSSATSGGESATHTHSIGSISAGTNGEPLHMTLLPYYRL